MLRIAKYNGVDISPDAMKLEQGAKKEQLRSEMADSQSDSEAKDGVQDSKYESKVHTKHCRGTLLELL